MVGHLEFLFQPEALLQHIHRSVSIVLEDLCSHTRSTVEKSLLGNIYEQKITQCLVCIWRPLKFSYLLQAQNFVPPLHTAFPIGAKLVSGIAVYIKNELGLSNNAVENFLLHSLLFFWAA